MKLGNYLAEQQLTQTAFAERIDTTPANVSRWIDGTRRPSGRMLMRIMLETDKAVTFDDFDWPVTEAAE